MFRYPVPTVRRVDFSISIVKASRDPKNDGASQVKVFYKLNLVLDGAALIQFN